MTYMYINIFLSGIMDATNKNISLLFYDYLCSVIGTKRVVQTRRQICNAVDRVMYGKIGTVISSGSKAEGLDLKGSDYDIMHVFTQCQVYENVNAIGKMTNKIHLIMDADDSPPGFTLLQLLDTRQRFNPCIAESCKAIGQKIYISSKLFREMGVERNENIRMHGPCQSAHDGSVDLAHTLHCREWITQAQQWITRSRTSWPDYSVCETIQEYGVLFVPIGFKDSPRKDLQFRISFSVAEKLLIYSFNHVQLLCYALMKIVLSDIISKKHEGQLCSYFLKTIMFWMAEETDKSAWKPENILHCFRNCFRRLVYCVEYSTCLHYFIPGNNMFEGRFDGAVKKDLLNTLNDIYNSGGLFILRSETLEGFLSPVITKFNTSAVPFLVYMNMVLFTLNIPYCEHKAMFGCLNLSGKQIYIMLLSLINQRLAQTVSLYDNRLEGNKATYKRYRKCLCHLLLGLNQDGISGWLLLASFFYTRKQYKECRTIIRHCLHKSTPDKILLCNNMDKKCLNEFDKQLNMVQKPRFLHACKTIVVDDVKFIEPSCLLPVILSHATGKPTIPSVVFANFLDCLCLHHLNQDDEKWRALHKLQLTIKEMYFIRSNSMRIKISNLCFSLAKQLLTN